MRPHRGRSPTKTPLKLRAQCGSSRVREGLPHCDPKTGLKRPALQIVSPTPDNTQSVRGPSGVVMRSTRVGPRFSLHRGAFAYPFNLRLLFARNNQIFRAILSPSILSGSARGLLVGRVGRLGRHASRHELAASTTTTQVPTARSIYGPIWPPGTARAIGSRYTRSTRSGARSTLSLSSVVRAVSASGSIIRNERVPRERFCRRRASKWEFSGASYHSV